MPSLINKLLTTQEQSASAIQKTIVKTAMVNAEYTITFREALKKRILRHRSN